VRVTAAVTILGLVLITFWLWLFGEFPPLMRFDVGWPVVAGCGFALATLWLFAAIASGPVSLAVPLTMAYPASSVVLAAILGNAPNLIQLMLIILIVGGVLVAASAESTGDEGSKDTSGRRRRTITFALLAHVTFVIAVFAGQRAAPLFGEVEAVWISRLAGALVVIPLLLISQDAARPRIAHFPLLALMAFLDVAAMSLLFAAGKTAQPELATVCATASGVVTVVLARIFLAERIAYLRWLGIALTFSGVAALSAVK
jgi:drug/metabolite transporter (DMT)-like permease